MIPGIDIRRLKPGTKIEVYTKHSAYQLEVLDYGGKCIMSGGIHVPEPLIAQYIGAAYRRGGPIRVGWISPFIGMEFILPQKIVLNTSSVIKARVIGEGWDYVMDWQEACDA